MNGFPNDFNEQAEKMNSSSMSYKLVNVAVIHEKG
jgi:hypothetical protein